MTAVAVRARVLAFDGSRRSIETTDVLAVARGGSIVAVEGLLADLGLLEPIRALYLAEIGVTVSDAAAAEVAARGLSRLHEVLTLAEVAAVLTALDRRVRPLTVPVTQGIMRAIAGPRPGPYFICDRMWVRAQVPTEVMGEHAPVHAPHLTGHLFPVGVHRDSWLTHPLGTLSLWAAIEPVTAGSTVELFEELTDDAAARPDRPAVDELRSIRPELAPGDVLVFDAARLHASVPNVTDTTRVAVTTRVVPGRRLRYGPGTHWRPFLDERLLDTRFASLASLQSRLTIAAFRRARWRRQVRRAS